MKKAVKIILTLIVLGVVVGGVIGWQMYNKPHKKAEDVKGIQLTVSQIANAYSADEAVADSLYLEKVIEVKGSVIESNKNQDGILVLMLGGDDPTAVVQCTMRDTTSFTAEVADELTVKGFCSGKNMFDEVLLTQCVIVE